MINDVVGFKKQRRKKKRVLDIHCVMYVLCMYIYIYKCISTFGNFNSKTRLV